MDYTYKGIPCLKDPIDLALYIKLIWEKQPRTIIEIGSFQGGSAIFYADLCQTYGLDTQIVTVDFRAIQHSVDARVRFIQADALNLAESDLHEALDSLPRPWLVIEDSAHTGEVTYAVLEYFEQRMQPGEVLIIEDGVIEDQGANEHYRGGPNRGVYRMFDSKPDSFRLMTEYTDFFGRNATFNPNGYLEKT
jgi:cephalosporin hydroxylase